MQGPGLNLQDHTHKHTNKSAIILTALWGPQGHEVIGVVHLAEAVNLDFNMIRGIRLQDFEYCACFIAVGFQGLPYALSNHPDQQHKEDTVTERQCGVTVLHEPAEEELSMTSEESSQGNPRRRRLWLNWDPPVVDIVHARSQWHFFGSHPCQSHIPGEVSCPLEILYFVYS